MIPTGLLGLGIVAFLLSWLIFYFLLILPIHRWISGILVVQLHKRFGLELAGSSRIVVTMVIVATILALSYLPGRLDLGNLCTTRWQPTIHDRVAVDGYLSDRYVSADYASFLLSRGFKYIETPAPSKSGTFVRYARTSDNKISNRETAELISRYAVRQEFSSRLSGVDAFDTVVYEIQSGRELARASNFTFYGGPLLGWLLPIDSLSCIDVLGPGGYGRRDAHESFIKTVLGSPSS